jgi:hypothetical protein
MKQVKMVRVVDQGQEASGTEYHYVVDDEPVVVLVRIYPLHKDQTRAVSDLLDAANDGCQICLWDADFSYPQMTQRLRDIFPHTIRSFSNDGPSGTKTKTDPIAAHFDTALHGNRICSLSGERTGQHYKDLGVKDVRYTCQNESNGFIEGLGDWVRPSRSCYADAWQKLPPAESTGFDFDRRMSQFRTNGYANDLVFVGGRTGPFRHKINSEAGQMNLRTRFYGGGMRDGLLGAGAVTGHDLNSDLREGSLVTKLYLDSFAVLNLQYIGLLSTRLFDAWASGSLLFMWDPIDELAEVGIHSGEHYVGFDGTVADLAAKVRYYQSHLDETERIIRAANKRSVLFRTEYGFHNTMPRILSDYKSKWGW